MAHRDAQHIGPIVDGARRPRTNREPDDRRASSTPTPTVQGPANTTPTWERRGLPAGARVRPAAGGPASAAPTIDLELGEQLRRAVLQSKREDGAMLHQRRLCQRVGAELALDQRARFVEQGAARLALARGNVELGDEGAGAALRLER